MLDTRFFTFLVLCQTKSFTKTAEELHITQPAVSHHIKYLEEYYNVKLYTYVGKKFHLTTSGEVLYQFVSSFYTDSERIKEQLRQSNSASAMLRLGAEQSAGESFLPYLIISNLKKNPDCRMRIVTDNYNTLSQMLNDGELDFFLMDGIVSKTEHDYYELYHSSVVCVCSSMHPLAGKTVPIEEVYNNTLILGADKTPSRKRLESIFRDNHISTIHFHNHIEINNSLPLVKQLLLHNIGISFLYKSAVASELREGILQQIFIENYYEFHAYNLVSLHNSYFHANQIEFIKFCQDFLRQWDSDL